jgi:hypothetical protein
MSSLQIPFSRWDWPNSERRNIDSNIHENNHHYHNHNHNHTHTNTNYYSNHGHSHSNNSKSNNHRSDVLNCSHPKSNPISSSLSSLSAMLLEGQAVLAHQTTNAIWLFIGLSNGTIWKWTIDLVRKQRE